MNRTIVIALAGMSLFGGLSMLAASAPAATQLTPAALRDAAASAAIHENVSTSGWHAFNAVDEPSLTSTGVVHTTLFGGTTMNDGVGHGLGHGWPKVAMTEVPSAARADILFDND